MTATPVVLRSKSLSAAQESGDDHEDHQETEPEQQSTQTLWTFAGRTDEDGGCEEGGRDHPDHPGDWSTGPSSLSCGSVAWRPYSLRRKSGNHRRGMDTPVAAGYAANTLFPLESGGELMGALVRNA